jgi:hypothetical protein
MPAVANHAVSDSLCWLAHCCFEGFLFNGLVVLACRFSMTLCQALPDIERVRGAPISAESAGMGPGLRHSARIISFPATIMALNILVYACPFAAYNPASLTGNFKPLFRMLTR